MKKTKLVLFLVSLFMSLFHSCGPVESGRRFYTDDGNGGASAADNEIAALQQQYRHMYCGSMKRMRDIESFAGQGVVDMKVNNEVNSPNLTIETVDPTSRALINRMSVGSYIYVCAFGDNPAGQTVENPNAFQAKKVVAAQGNIVSFN